jgi:hypothetical protein
MRLGTLLAVVVALAACRGEEPSGPVFSLRDRQGAQAPAAPPSEASAFPATPLITGTVEVDESLASAPRPPEATLFIIARGRGPGGEVGPPALVKRVTPVSLPYTFVLSTDDQMVRGTPLPGAFVVSARLDTDGDAISRTPGDLAGSVKEAVQQGASGVRLLLDERVSEARPSAPVR